MDCGSPPPVLPEPKKIDPVEYPSFRPAKLHTIYYRGPLGLLDVQLVVSDRLFQELLKQGALR